METVPRMWLCHRWKTTVATYAETYIDNAPECVSKVLREVWDKGWLWQPFSHFNLLTKNRKRIKSRLDFGAGRANKKNDEVESLYTCKIGFIRNKNIFCTQKQWTTMYAHFVRLRLSIVRVLTSRISNDRMRLTIYKLSLMSKRLLF